MAAPRYEFDSWRLAARLAALAAIIAAGSVDMARLIPSAYAQATSPSPPATPVQFAAAARQDVPVYLTGLGTVQAFNTVTVRVQVDGQLQKVFFTEGQVVKKGDLLAQIDPRSFQAALEQASAKQQQDQANLDNAERQLTRFQQLARQDFASQQALDNQQSAVEQLKAQVAQDEAAKDAAAVQLSYTRLVAPLGGRTGVRMIDEGNIVHATDSTGLVVITQTQPISVLSTLPENELPAVRSALQAGSVSVAALTSDGATELAKGTLSLINNETNQQNGTIELKSTFPNENEALWPGQFVTLRLQVRLVTGAITVPSAAVQRGPNGFFVYVIGSGNIIAARPVTVGQAANGLTVVLGGLAEGEHVVTSGSYRIEPGVKVSPTGAATPVTAGTGP